MAMRLIAPLAAIAFASTCLVTSGPVRAANVNFHDLLDTTAVDATQFDVSGPTITYHNVFGGEDDVTVSGSFFTTSGDGSGGNTVYVFENGTGSAGSAAVSDVIQSSWSVSGGIANLTLNFGSDPISCNEPGTPLCAAFSLSLGKFEDGFLQNVNDMLSLPNNITVQIQSDIPEPASLALLSLALVGVGAVARRRKTD